jgi:hypothetical protein
MTTFRQQLETASALLNTDQPVPNETIDAITEVLFAKYGSASIVNEIIDEILFDEDGDAHITTSYRSKGWDECDSYTIPAKIIDAENPVRAATEQVLRNRLEWAVSELTVARNAIPKLEEASQTAALNLATFLKEQP